MDAEQFLLSTEPYNIYDPPTPDCMNQDEILDDVIPKLDWGRRTLLAHYRDWMNNGGSPLRWEDAKMYLARNGAGHTLELHVKAPREDEMGLKYFGATLLHDVPFVRIRNVVDRKVGYKTYRSTATAEDLEDEETKTKTEKTMIIPAGARYLIVTTTDEDVEVEYSDGNGFRGTYQEFQNEYGGS